MFGRGRIIMDIIMGFIMFGRGGIIPLGGIIIPRGGTIIPGNPPGNICACIATTGFRRFCCTIGAGGLTPVCSSLNLSCFLRYSFHVASVSS